MSLIPKPLDLEIDFKSAKFARKLKSAHQGEQPLKKALLTRGKRVFVVDATAGRGEDSFLMAEWGFKVVSFEKNPEVFKQLSRALAALVSTDPAGKLILSEQLAFFEGDFCAEILKRKLRPEVIFLDPMYPETKKSARSEKQIENLRATVGVHDEDLEETLKKALKLAQVKVVLKRPKSVPCPFKPQHVYKGSSTRYEVYLSSVELKRAD